MFNRSVAARLMAPLVISMLLLCALAGITWHTQRTIAAADAAALQAQVRIFDLGELRSISRSLQRDALNLVTETDAEELATIGKKFFTRTGKMADGLSALEAAPNHSDIPDDYFKTQYAVVSELTKVAERAKGGDQHGALLDFQLRVRPAERAASKIADDRIDALNAQIIALRASADATASAAQKTGFTATALLAAFGLVAGFFITRRGVVTPLHQLRARMGSLAAGDTDSAVPYIGRADEVGQMAQSIATFRDQLGTAERAKQAETALREQQAELIIESIGRGLDAIAKGDLSARVHADLTGPFAKLKTDFNLAMEELAGAMMAVSRSTNGIHTGVEGLRQASDELSHRTEVQAASLEETAAAMDEITSTVRNSAEGASRANVAVGEARIEAQRSGEVLRRAIEAMAGIERSSTEISDIITVIDGIAFQTNLLALNAGVEAARAGDAGRGFAVVASEVRALAQRSADAAKDVKSRITASSQHVDAGVKLVSETDHALNSIITRIANISTLVSDIALSAEQQASSIQQLNTAVAEMDGVTQQNAAMVEEATAAARSLAAEADALAEQVARFTIDGAPKTLATTRPAAAVHRLPSFSAESGRRARRAGTRGKTALAVADDDWASF